MVFTRLTNPTRLKRWLLIAAWFIALLVVCSALGRPLLNPFVPVRFEGPSLVSGNARGTVVVDRARMRLLFATPRGNLVEVVEVGRGDEPIDEITEIEQRDDTVYVAGVRHAADGEGVASEAVLSYGMDGRLQDVLWQEAYKEGELHPTPAVVDLASDDTGVMLALVDGWGSNARLVRLLHVDDDTVQTEVRSITASESLVDVSYNSKTGSCLFISVTGDVLTETAENAMTHLLRAGSSDRYSEVDASGQTAVAHNAVRNELVLVGDLDGDAHSVQLELGDDPYSVRLVGNMVYAALKSGTLWKRSLRSGVTTQMVQLTLAPALVLRYLALFACALFIVLRLAMHAVRLLCKLLEEGERDRLGRVLISLSVGLLFVVAGTFYSAASLREAWEVRNKELQQMSTFLSFLSPGELGDCAAREVGRMEQEVSADDGPDYRALSHAAHGLMLTGEKSGIGVGCRIYVRTGEANEVRVLLSSKNDAVFGEEVGDGAMQSLVHKVYAAGAVVSGDELELTNDVDASTVSVTQREGREYASIALAPLLDSSGQCQAVVEVSSNMVSLLRQQALSILDTTLSFLLVAVGVYLLTEEELSTGKAVLRYRELKAQGVEWARVLLDRPLVFICGIASGMDVALAVVLVKGMFLAVGDKPDARLLAAPILAATLGPTLAPHAIGVMEKRLSKRGYTQLSIGLAVLAQVLCYAAVINHWFEAYLVGRFVMSVGYAIALDSIKDNISLAEGQDKAFARDALQASKPAGIVAGIIGGQVALVGSELIYVISAVFGLLLLGGCGRMLSMMPADRERPSGKAASKPSQEQHDAMEGQGRAGRLSRIRGVSSYLLSPSMLVTLLFGMVPLAIAGGYRSYVFPLFLSASHLTHSQLANLFVMAEVIMYVANDSLNEFRKTHDRWMLTWLSLVSLGASFALFAKNQSVVWALVAVIVINVLRWFAGDCKYFAREWAKADYGMSEAQASAVVSDESMVVDNVRSPAMGAFLSLGAERGCLALGVYLAVCGALYAWGTSKHVRSIGEHR